MPHERYCHYSEHGPYRIRPFGNATLNLLWALGGNGKPLGVYLIICVVVVFLPQGTNDGYEVRVETWDGPRNGSDVG